MDEIKGELIHIITDPLPPEAPVPTVSCLRGADKTPYLHTLCCCTQPRLPWQTLVCPCCSSTAGSPVVVPPAERPCRSDADALRATPTPDPHTRQCRKGNGAGAPSAHKNQISAWDFPNGYLSFSLFGNNMTSVIRGVSVINRGSDRGSDVASLVLTKLSLSWRGLAGAPGGC